MKDVAEHAGVSISTVSYVLNDSGPVAAERRARVLDAVRVLNYTPNESARNLKRRSASTVGLVVPDLSNPFFALLAEGVERAASARGVLVVLCAPEATGETESLNGRLLRSQRLDGIIYLSGAATSPASLLELTRLGPVVLVDEQLPGFDLPSIVSDNRRGARELARHVLDQGHERVAVIGGPKELWTAEQRLAGYREAFAAAGRDPDAVPVLVGDYHLSSGSELAARALAGSAQERPTALLCANDLMAIGALEYCKLIGARVPEDLSVAGFDDLPFASLLTPRLTTVRQPAHEMGQCAANLLFDLLEGKEDAQPGQPFPVTVQV
ncbi:MAG: LacI family transcriptional regulator, partial [Actinomycetota bacterium]|nr:LacI family transcriptional regulator [Actinomycetota bacterium]